MFAGVCVGTSVAIDGPDSQANCCVNDLGTGNVSCDEQPLIDRAQNVPTPINVNTSKLMPQIPQGPQPFKVSCSDLNLFLNSWKSSGLILTFEA